MGFFSKSTTLSLCLVGFVVVACSEKKSKEESQTVEFVTEQIDLSAPKKSSTQAELTAEEMKEAQEIYLLSSESSVRLHKYIALKSDSPTKKTLKEKKLSKASSEVKNLVKMIQEKCIILSPDSEQTEVNQETFISGDNCPINERIQVQSFLKPLRPVNPGENNIESTGVYSIAEEVKYDNKEVIALTKVKSLKSSLSQKIKDEISRSPKKHNTYFKGTGKIEVITGNDKPLTLNLKIEGLITVHEEKTVANSRGEAKLSLSTGKEVTITVLKSVINEVTVSKKVFINDKEITADLD